MDQFPAGDFPSLTSQAYSASNVNPYTIDSLIDLGSSRRIAQSDPWAQQVLFQQQITPTKSDPMPNTECTRRYVQVFIADPNENVPLAESVLYKGDQKLTDLTDTELYFEVPMAEILKTHNGKRVCWTDKDATKKAGKDVFLDPVKIRDLKMVVVTIAQF
jgi:hypothetical protein